jgi:predicted  nucleic acid-binding Zn-ribbon protein
MNNQNFNDFNATKPKDKAVSNISDNTRKQKIVQILAKIDTAEQKIANLTNLMQQSKNNNEIQEISKEIVLQQKQLEKLEETWTKLE